MTEKPFKLDDFDSEVEMWELLNTQREIIIDLEKENKQLREEIKDYEDTLARFEEKNKQLQIELNTYKAGNRTLKKRLDEIRNHLNENEEIT